VADQSVPDQKMMSSVAVRTAANFRPMNHFMTLKNRS
jgi:hypothetical protein